jgi:hypothetical protein
MYVPRIHLIETKYDISLSQDDSGIYESCCWKYLEEETQRLLMNGRIYFHPTKKDRAHTSGTIVGFRPAGRRRPDSVIILFKKDQNTDEVTVEDLNDWGPTGMEHKDIYPYRQIIL